jgi:MoaA/NifB/PqqE/SkfB family radical SAM enzyme
MSYVELFGKQIPVRSHHCKYYDNDPEPIEPYINVYVRSKGCNATCKFCEFSNDAHPFNFDKYLEILNEVKKVRVKKFSFTGGEPTLNYNQFRKIILLTREHHPDSSFVLNSNGLNLTKIKDDLEIYNELDSISLSRHHYLDEINNEIFGFKSISSEEIKEIQLNSKNKSLINLSCNLTKGYIDSKEEVYKYLEYANSIGIQWLGLVSLMPINDYCKENLIDFNSLDLVSDRFNLTKVWSYENYCRCNNYVYIPEDLNNVIRVYYKYTYNPYDININLVFDGENLTTGFTNNIII